MQTEDRNKNKFYCTTASEAEVCADKYFEKGHSLKNSVFLPQTWVTLLDTLQTLLNLVFAGHSYPGEQILQRWDLLDPSTFRLLKWVKVSQ